jgi:transmembrane sensor
MMSEDTAVGIERNRPLQIALRLESGSARFDVVPNQKREFVVRAGSVEVGVLGTIFDVERDHGRVRVSVSRGKVRVRQLNEPGASIVKAGESAWFNERGEQLDDDAPAHAEEPANPEPSKRALQPSAAKSHGRAHRGGSHEEAPRAAWRSLSQSGDYEGAYRLLLQESSVEDDSGALLDAADAARLSGHPEAALRYLREVLDHHRDSPVSPLAAFTMGRILLERLGQPTEAAEAFAMARRLAPQGSLAQDALAREVEAWSKAGHPDEAYQRARQYVTSYPQGRRLHAVQLYGGLSAP